MSEKFSLSVKKNNLISGLNQEQSPKFKSYISFLTINLKSKDTVLILASVVLFSLSYPPSPLSFLAYIFFPPFLLVLEKKSIKESFKLGYVWGFLSNLILLFWIAWVSFPGMLGAVLILALYPALWSLLFTFVKNKNRILAYICAPFFWLALEYIRGLSQIGFPWLDVGYTQSFYTNFIQFASFTGIYGVSLWVIVINFFFWGIYKNHNNLKIITVYAITLLISFLLPVFYGNRVLSDKPNSASVKVALVQGNIDVDVKWDPQFLNYNFDVFCGLTEKLKGQPLDLIIWPETAAPCYLAYDSVYLNRVKETCDIVNVDILLGANHYKIIGPEQYVYYNNTFLFKPDMSISDSYSKIHLVPFGERLPFDEKVKILKDLHLGQADFSAGNEYTVFRNQKGKFAGLICFEMVFPDLVRQFVKRGSDFLVNITNDGWYGKTPAPYQHAYMSIYRAIENRIPVARCANTGISMFVDPFGRVLQKSELFTQEILVNEIPLRQKTTFYTKYGDWLSHLSLILSLLFISISILIKKKSY